MTLAQQYGAVTFTMPRPSDLENMDLTSAMKDTVSESYDQIDEADILVTEAQMLRSRAVGSARSVILLVLVVTGNLLSLENYQMAGAWFTATTAMALATLGFARLFWKQDLTPQTAPAYLRGHVVISALTGLLWGGFAIAIADQNQPANTIASGLFIAAITTGGIMAGTIYRPGFIALATGLLVPYGAYLTVTMQGVLQVGGVFFLLFYMFCFTTNKNVSLKTREAIAANITSAQTRAALAEVEAKRRLQTEKARFLSSISHDLAQPLLTQRNLLARLENTVKDQDLRTLIQQVQSCQDSQEKLLNEMSFANQLGEVLPNIQKSHFNVAHMFTQLLAGQQSDQTQARFSSRIDPAAKLIFSDPHVVERILRNLLGNAVKYGGPAPQITLSAQLAGDRAILSVQDDGPGIAKEFQGDVFAAHVRLPKDRSMPGSGLGLSICHSLAEQLGGTLELISAPGEGTEVRLSLPQDSAEIASGKTQVNRFVLFIGPERSPIYGDWNALFSEWFWGCAHARNCSEALELVGILKLKPDVILISDPSSCPSATDDMADLSAVAPVLGLKGAGDADQLDGPVAYIDTPSSSALLRGLIEAHL